ncbi:MAG: GNAT family N-acetyltransferase [Lachnospiraceae bacterium]|nr:GNAT family N-acetyltransferase [Lachnospiraceae bacterium]
MRIICKDVVIRDFESKDVNTLREIVAEPGIVRFMKDWWENSTVPGRLEGYVDWLQTQSESVDVLENKRYAIALKETDEVIGMVGMGLEENTNEVEVAYFMRESCQHKGYAKQAVTALANWCFEVSKLPYLILTIDPLNTASCMLAEKCGFELFEKRTPVGHIQPNMESESYFYYRKYREGGEGRRCSGSCRYQ